MQSGPSKYAGSLPAEHTNRQQTLAIMLLAIVLLPLLVWLYTQNQVLGAVSETIAGWQTTRSLVERGDLDLDEFHPGVAPCAFPHAEHRGGLLLAHAVALAEFEVDDDSHADAQDRRRYRSRQGSLVRRMSDGIASR